VKFGQTLTGIDEISAKKSVYRSYWSPSKIQNYTGTTPERQLARVVTVYGYGPPGLQKLAYGRRHQSSVHPAALCSVLLSSLCCCCFWRRRRVLRALLCLASGSRGAAGRGKPRGVQGTVRTRWTGTTGTVERISTRPGMLARQRQQQQQPWRGHGSLISPLPIPCLAQRGPGPGVD
jgi:hypothetical protein